jgi:excisionase family DNA binding protein
MRVVTQDPKRGGRKQPPPVVPEVPVLLTVPEVIELTKLSRTWVWKQVRTRRLPTLKMGRRRLVRYRAFEEWLDSFGDEPPQSA